VQTLILQVAGALDASHRSWLLQGVNA